MKNKLEKLYEWLNTYLRQILSCSTLPTNQKVITILINKVAIIEVPHVKYIGMF